VARVAWPSLAVLTSLFGMRNSLMKSCRAAAVACGLAAAACGGGSSSSGAPAAPRPRRYSVAVTVFHDENANGQLDANEAARVPGVVVVIAPARHEPRRGPVSPA